MRRFAFALIAVLSVLVVPASAAAKGGTTTIAPPGNSGVSQYVETVPTAHGGQPTSSVHNHSGGSGNARGNGGGPGGSSGGSSGTSSGSGGSGSGAVGSGSGSSQGSALPSSTQRALAAHGANGRAAAAVLGATAPAVAMQHTSRAVVPVAPAGSPASAVFKALTGSSTNGGLGAILPIILVASLLALTAFAIGRRRRTSA
jgi:hypothetical protein